MTWPREITALSGAAIAGGIGIAVKCDSTTTINRAGRRQLIRRGAYLYADGVRPGPPAITDATGTVIRADM